MASLPAAVDQLSDDDQQPIDAVSGAIRELSDDEQHLQPDAPPPPPGPVRTKRQKPLGQNELREHAHCLQIAVNSKCKCKDPSCKSAWKNNPGAFDALLQKRLQLHQLPKLEADRDVSSADCSMCADMVC